MAIKLEQLYYDSRPATEKEATKRGNLLSEYMVETTLGTWVADVFENMGWHYKAISGILSISPTGHSVLQENEYVYQQTLFITSLDGGGTISNWYSKDSYDIDPYQALLKAIKVKDKVLREYLDSHEKSIATMHKLLIDLKKGEINGNT